MPFRRPIYEFDSIDSYHITEGGALKTRLKAEQAGFKKIFESMPGLFLLLLPDFTIFEVSDAYANATMVRREDVIGKHLFDVFPDNPDKATSDGVSNLRASLNHVLQSKTPHSMPIQQYDIRKPDGNFEERFWSPLNTPVFNSENQISFIIHRVEDVTEFVHVQKEKAKNEDLARDLRERHFEMEQEIIGRSKEIQKLNEELERKVEERTASLETLNKDISDYKFALDASSIVAVTDQKGIIQHVNENFCKISKYSVQELLGKDHRIINSGFHPKEFIRELWTTIANGRIWKGELRNRAKDGTIYWVDTTIVPFLDAKGKPYKYLAIRADITQRRLAEETILKMNEELEQKVEERTLELTSTLQHMQAMNELKSRFVSMASHEFRTPLSAILSSVSLIEAYHSDEQVDKRKKHIARIKSSIRNMTEILNDFLSIDRLEQGKMEVYREPFDLPAFCEDIVEEVSGMLKEGQLIEFAHNEFHEVVQDKKILRHILLNLLSNAIKYSQPNSKILLLVRVEEEQVCLKVHDHGIGIPEDEQAFMFEKFFRGRNAVNIQGTGLGLNIVKRYVELLDGSIGFVSNPEQGTTFSVAFPRFGE